MLTVDAIATLKKQRVFRDAAAGIPSSAAQAIRKSCRFLRLQHDQVSCIAAHARLTVAMCSSSLRNPAKKSPSSTGSSPESAVLRAYVQSTVLEKPSDSTSTTRRPIPRASCYVAHSKSRFYRSSPRECHPLHPTDPTDVRPLKASGDQPLHFILSQVCISSRKLPGSWLNMLSPRQPIKMTSSVQYACIHLVRLHVGECHCQVPFRLEDRERLCLAGRHRI